ncbi:MAG: site-specific integrase [Prevotella sp.]|nr:site-specific integrase [Prevotella sp.]
MARTKKINRESSFVTLRTKAVSKGRLSFYLDIYKDGQRKYEFLKLYLVPATNEAAKVQNANTEQAAKAIRNQRELEIIQGKGGLAPVSNSKLLLLDWMEEYRKLKLSTGQSEERALSVKKVINHLKEYKGEKVKLSAVDDEFCKGFIAYLGNATSVKHKNSKPLASITANSYFQIFTSALNEAVRQKKIPINPIMYLSREDKKPIKAERSNRTFLTIDEVKKLADTDIKNENIKRAFLFACFTGLRISDIKNLTWSNIIERDNAFYISITMQKTREPLTIKLNKQAVSWLPKKGSAKEVFNLPFYNTVINDNLKRWAKAAGIEKKLCFHMSRHTFATMELTLGADLYVVSKLLGHHDLSVTQVYADIINRKREKAVDLLDKAFTSKPQRKKQSKAKTGTAKK